MYNKFLLFITLAVSVTPAPTNVDDNNFKLIIIHNNDMHARFEQTNQYTNKCEKKDAAENKCYGGFARVAHLVREYREKANKGEIAPVLYLNAGDTYTGTPWFSLYKDNITATFLNALKPDAISLGNHEFDEGTKNLGSFLKEINFPVLAANVDVSKELPLQADTLKNSEIFVKNGVKIGVIGYLTPETKQLAGVNDVEYIDEIVAINAETAKLKAQGVNILIALGHSGLARDRQIAAGCPDIDLVIGGHSHTFLYTGKGPDIEEAEDNYPVEIVQKSGRKVPVVQAYAFTKYLGFLDLEFDKDGNLLKIDGTPKLLNGTVARDPDVLAILEKYRPGMEELENTVVGSTKVFLDGNCRHFECNLGNFISDSMVDWNAVNYAGNDSWTDAAIGIIQGGGIRSSIDHKANNGNITLEAASTVLPFGNKIVMLEVTGKELIEALENSVHRYTKAERYGEFLQMSGMQVLYNISKPGGQRVVSAQALCTKCFNPSFADIVLTEKYRILTNSFVGEGGDGFTMFQGKVIKTFEETELVMFDSYLKKKSPVYPAVEWRISFTDDEETPPEPTEDPNGDGGSTTLQVSLFLLLVNVIVAFRKL